jgi:hypothetical protein
MDHVVLASQEERALRTCCLVSTWCARHVDLPPAVWAPAAPPESLDRFGVLALQLGLNDKAAIMLYGRGEPEDRAITFFTSHSQLFCRDDRLALGDYGDGNTDLRTEGDFPWKSGWCEREASLSLSLGSWDGLPC